MSDREIKVSERTPMPKQTSLDYKIGDLRKNKVVSLLDDGWNAKNALTATLKMLGTKPDHYMKANCVHNLSTKDDELSIRSSLDLETRLRWNVADVKATVKGGRWTKHFDRRQSEWKYNWNGKERSIWVNPYLVASASMDWNNWITSLGAIVNMCKEFSGRFQLNHDVRDGSDENSSWSLENNMRLSHNKLWVDWYYTVNLANPLAVLHRIVRLGWNDVKYDLTAHAEKVGSGGENSLMDSLSVGLAYKGEDWTLGARVKGYMDDRQPHVEVGGSKVLNTEWQLKTKVDNELNWNLLTTWRMCSAVNSEWGLAGNFNGAVKGGLYGAPLKLGLKLNINK